MRQIRKLVWMLFTIATLSYAFPHEGLLGLNLTFADLLYLISFYVIVINRLAKKVHPLPILSKEYSPVWVILFLLGTGSMLSAFKSINPIGSLSNFIQYVFIFIVLLTVIEFLINKKGFNAIKIAVIFLTPNIITVAFVLLSNYEIFNNLDEVIIARDGRYRGFDGLATEFGSRLGTVYAVVLYFISVCKNRILKLLLLVIAAGFAYATLLSGSFSSALILFCATIGYLWFLGKNKSITRLISVVIVLFVAVVYYQIAFNNNFVLLEYAPEIMQKRFLQADNNFGSITIRGDLNVIGLESFFSNPIIGVGYGQFKHFNVYDASIHNTLISAAAETGILGLLGVTLYVFLPLVYSQRLARYYNNDKNLKNFINFLSLYSVIRIANTFISQEFINRELWVPILIVFVIYAYTDKETDVNAKLNFKRKETVS